MAKKTIYTPITTAGNFLVIADKDGHRRVLDGLKQVPKGATRIAGFAVESDAFLFSNALYQRDNPPPKPDNYRDDARDNAVEMAEHFLDEIVEQLADDGKASDDYNNDYDGGDSYHHESHVDKDYSWKEAAELLEQLDEYEETDSGLWEGQDWEKVLATKAAFTYGNAVGSNWNDLIEKINEAFDDANLDIPDDVEAANARKAELDEIGNRTEDEDAELRIVQAVIDGKDGDDAKKEEIKKLVERTITEFKS